MGRNSTTFAPGHPKYGGRKLKSKNKITRDLASLMNKLSHNPIEALVLVAQDSNVEVAIRTRANSELARYIHPQLKSVELSGPGGGPIEVNDVSATELIRGRIARLAQRTGPGDDTPGT